MSIVLDRYKVDAALPKIASGLSKYLKIMEFVANDLHYYDNPDFRRTFN